MGYISRLSKQK